ncbi:thermonuclease family protein [Kaistia geumhonensis]|uniref:Endonuclease YncB(Thermonuclease family) n=1 Tax=Kaistia geumhonensis TaxID=410839 RepID=A0ABU0M8F3_9HYPH|nr:thermonuclease family protein [Kaistia geumhonensis]MCX5477590.1 thermonuclease family protein [Kaistia geumhonensis]MDQ0517202.1 endonuclease YncB(thermonuclease family) [Kaistia geumhonensis]
MRVTALHRHVLGLCAGLGLAGAMVHGAAAEDACAGQAAEQATVAAVLDGATLALDSGRIVRLAGILAPEPPLGRDAEEWPIATAARTALGSLALGRAVTVAATPAGADRYGRGVALVGVVDGPASLSEAMVAIGLARAMPAGEAPSCLAALFSREREAREKRLGLWAEPYYAIRAARDPALAEREDAYDLVEGRILSVGERGPTAYLDFGRDWRTDFTAVVSGPAGEALAARGVPVSSLEGRRVRLRGWIEQKDGPSLRITDPGQLELLDDGG